mgnify:CR=1 FL=1
MDLSFSNIVLIVFVALVLLVLQSAANSAKADWWDGGGQQNYGAGYISAALRQQLDVYGTQGRSRAQMSYSGSGRTPALPISGMTPMAR